MSSTSTRITVAVSDYWILGTLPLENTRIQDLLNDSSTAFLQLHDVEVHKLANCDCIATLSNLVVPKNKLEFILVPSDKHEAPDKRWNNRKSKQGYTAFTILSQYSVFGTLHLDTEPTDSRYVLTHQLGSFFALTDACVHRGGRGVKQLHVPLLLANTDFVNCFEVGNHIKVKGSPDGQASSQSQVDTAEEKSLTGLLDKVHSLLDDSRAATEAEEKSSVH